MIHKIQIQIDLQYPPSRQLEGANAEMFLQTAICASFKWRDNVVATKLGNQPREKGRQLDTRTFLSADNKRCSVRGAAQLSCGRPRRPALVATAKTESMVYSAKRREYGRSGGRTAC
jgi:hypothetical protein